MTPPSISTLLQKLKWSLNISKKSTYPWKNSVMKTTEKQKVRKQTVWTKNNSDRPPFSTTHWEAAAAKKNTSILAMIKASFSITVPSSPVTKLCPPFSLSFCYQSKHRKENRSTRWARIFSSPHFQQQNCTLTYPRHSPPLIGLPRTASMFTNSASAT